MPLNRWKLSLKSVLFFCALHMQIQGAIAPHIPSRPSSPDFICLDDEGNEIENNEKQPGAIALALIENYTPQIHAQKINALKIAPEVIPVVSVKQVSTPPLQEPGELTLTASEIAIVMQITEEICNTPISTQASMDQLHLPSVSTPEEASWRHAFKKFIACCACCTLEEKEE